MINFDLLHNLINEELITKAETKNEITRIILEETDPSAKLKSIQIKNVSENAVLIKMDDILLINKKRYDQLKKICKDKKSKLTDFKPFEHSVIKNLNGAQKCCDYILIDNLENNAHIFFIELKSKKYLDKEIDQQFKGAECLIDYFDSILKKFQGKNLFNCLKRRYIVFSIKKLNKTTTKYKQESNEGTSSDNFFEPVISPGKSNQEQPFVYVKSLM
jgi:hypothetical protein